jgi:lipid-A-disaccharide synthase
VGADVFLVAGEASGDLQASLLSRAMRAIKPALTIAGVGGERMRAAGVDVELDSVGAEWASLGPISAFFKIPWLLTVMLGLAERIRARRPRLLVCVDFGAFNLRMLEWLRFTGYRGAALYYFPPGAWLDNAEQARKVARVATVLTPFAHQRDFYRSLGLAADFVGHPLVEAIARRDERPRRARPRIAVLPGSRRDEVAMMLPVLAQAASRASVLWGAHFAVVAASEARAAQITSLWAAAGGPAGIDVVRSDAADAVLDADLAWTASGTAVLESALRGVPQVAFYRLTDALYRIAQRRVPHIVRGPITLPNLIAGRAVVPELLQYDFTPERLLEESRALLDDAGAAAAQANGYEEVRALLGPPDSLQRIAAHAAGLLDVARQV